MMATTKSRFIGIATDPKGSSLITTICTTKEGALKTIKSFLNEDWNGADIEVYEVINKWDYVSNPQLVPVDLT